MNVATFKHEKKHDWEFVINEAKNGTFLLSRNYMDYHSNKFADQSLLVYEDETPIAVFPANKKKDSIVISHEGLTYGGLITSKFNSAKKNIQCFSKILEHYSSMGVETLKIKIPPAFYNLGSAEEIEYALFICKAELYRLDITSVINMKGVKINYQERKMRSIKKGSLNNFKIEQSNNYRQFWQEVLIPNLNERYKLSPTHTLEEITFLAEQNSPHIKLHTISLDNIIQAGVLIFETHTTAHAQYIASTMEGKRNNSLDFLFHYLITELYKEKEYFDFGISNENEGKNLNSGLLEWKEGFGARSVAHKFYEVETKNFHYLNTLLNN